MAGYVSPRPVEEMKKKNNNNPGMVPTLTDSGRSTLNGGGHDGGWGRGREGGRVSCDPSNSKLWNAELGSGYEYSRNRYQGTSKLDPVVRVSPQTMVRGRSSDESSDGAARSI